MKRIDFIREFAKEAGLTQKDAKEISEVMFDVIVKNMKDEDGVSPVAGVKFVAVHKDARTARNPMTGETIAVPEKYSPKVKFGTSIKEAVNA